MRHCSLVWKYDANPRALNLRGYATVWTADGCMLLTRRARIFPLEFISTRMDSNTYEGFAISNTYEPEGNIATKLPSFLQD